MTLHELNTLFDWVTELNTAKELKASLVAAASPGAQSFDGMPHATGVTDKVGELGVELAYIDEYIQSVERKIRALRRRVEAFIDGIESIQLRMIFRYRFLCGMPWKEVADKLGGRNTADGVKSAVYRFLSETHEVAPQ